MQSPRHPLDRVRMGDVGAAGFVAPAAAELPDAAEAPAPSKAAAAEAAAVPAKDEHTQMQELLGAYIVGGMTCNLIFLGEKLGLYHGLKEHGPCTAADLASALGLNERYVTEWLRQQASAKVVSTDAEVEQFWLTAAQADVLVNEHGPDASPHFFGGVFSCIPAMSRMVESRLVDCFKSGAGISYDEIEPAVTCGVCRELGVWARHALVPSLCLLPGMREQLEAGCQVADVGCGCGEALMAVAAAFPTCTCTGFDIAEDALKVAREEVARRGLANVEFVNPGLDDRGMPEQAFQLVMTHDAIHDMAHPQQVLESICKAVAPGGIYIVGDMSALDSHAENVHNHPLAPLLYGFSCHLCLPSGMSAPDGAALGTTGISAGKMKEMLCAAGFRTAEVLPEFQHPLNRYYIATV